MAITITYILLYNGNSFLYEKSLRITLDHLLQFIGLRCIFCSNDYSFARVYVTTLHLYSKLYYLNKGSGAIKLHIWQEYHHQISTQLSKWSISGRHRNKGINANLYKHYSNITWNIDNFRQFSDKFVSQIFIYILWKRIINTLLFIVFNFNILQQLICKDVIIMPTFIVYIIAVIKMQSFVSKRHLCFLIRSYYREKIKAVH